jgi:branched-chain amino acid aminotransferase
VSAVFFVPFVPSWFNSGTTMPTAWFNGHFIDDDAPAITLKDTGLLHAAGVFTTMRAYNGRVFRLSQHLQRLRNSCEALFVPLQHSDADLAGAVDELLDRNNLKDARLRLTVTRGQSTQDPLHGQHLSPNCFLTATELTPYPPEFYQRGMLVLIEDEQKLNPYDVQAGHKTLNYFSRLTAMRQATRQTAGEALWFNVHNYLQSGSVSNVFIVKDGALITPPTPADLRDPAIAQACPYPKAAVLPGITRQTVLDLAAANDIAVRIAAININQLLEADEVFLTNSAMQIMPVGRIEKHEVGPGQPGELTRRLMILFDQEVKRD